MAASKIQDICGAAEPVRNRLLCERGVQSPSLLVLRGGWTARGWSTSFIVRRRRLLVVGQSWAVQEQAGEFGGKDSLFCWVDSAPKMAGGV